MRRRLAVLAVAGGVMLTFLPASHAAPFVIDDPKGDAVAGTQAALDIERVTYRTTGTSTTTKVRGKRVTTYTPSTLLITLTLSAPPRSEAGFRYKVNAEVDGCGFVDAQYAPGTAFASLVGPGTVFLECGGTADPAGGGLLLTPKTTVDGSSITWTLPLKTLPKEVRAGATLHDVVAYTDLVEPALGSEGPTDYGVPAAFDTATSDKTWTIG